MAHWDRGKGGGEHDRPVDWRFRLILLGCGVATWAVQMVLKGRPDWVETYFTGMIYPVFRELTGTLTGWTSFALFEFVLLIAAAILIYRIVRNARAIYLGRRSWRNLAAHTLSGALALAGVLYTWGMVSWGFNYYRHTFLHLENLDRAGITATELSAVARKLAAEAKELRIDLREDDRGVMRTEDGPRAALKRAGVAYEVRGQEYASLRDGYVSRPKGLVLPILPWLKVSGLFFPYTGEPSVGLEQPDHDRLFAACHELAHQHGWAREDEANFIGYAACRRHPDADYRYAAAQEALGYALWALRRMDGDAAAVVLATIDDAVLRDWQASRDFWSRYDTRLGDAAMQVNDVYLKAQGQEEGIGSYGLMVDLLVADHRRGAP